MFGHTFKTRKDNNVGIYSKRFVNADMSIDGIVVNHNAYNDGLTQYCRNFEVTLFRKNIENQSFVKKEDCELNAAILLESLDQFEPHDNQTNHPLEYYPPMHLHQTLKIYTSLSSVPKILNLWLPSGSPIKVKGKLAMWSAWECARVF